jgi:hypothetical protein
MTPCWRSSPRWALSPPVTDRLSHGPLAGKAGRLSEAPLSWPGADATDMPGTQMPG